MLKNEKIYILKDEKLKVKMIQLYYDMPTTKHKKKQKTIELVTRNYQQSEIIKDIEKYVKS